MERAYNGARTLAFPGGASRAWLKDGDRLTLTGWCQGEGFRVGFGELSARILPAL